VPEPGTSVRQDFPASAQDAGPVADVQVPDVQFTDAPVSDGRAGGVPVAVSSAADAPAVTAPAADASAADAPAVTAPAADAPAADGAAVTAPAADAADSGPAADLPVADPLAATPVAAAPIISGSAADEETVQISGVRTVDAAGLGTAEADARGASQGAGQGRGEGSGQGDGAGQGQGQGRASLLMAGLRQSQNLLALALYTGASLGMFGPWILSRMSTWFLSEQAQDGSLFVWSFRWWPYALSHHISAIFSNAAWAPDGINLTWATTIPGPAIALQGLTDSHGPFFSFNVVELAAPALAAWTAYLLCRRLTGSFLPALIGGFFFGFSPSLIDEFGQGHPSLTLVFLIPLAAYLVVRLLEGSIHPAWFVLLLGIVLGMQLYIGEEVFATMTLVGLVCGLVGFAVGPAERRRRLLRAVAPVAGAYLIAAVAASPLLYTAFTRPQIVKALHYATIEYGAHRSADFLRYVTPGRYTVLYSQFGSRWGDNPWYLGIPLIVVIVLFAVTERRRRSSLALLAGLIVLLALSLGDSFRLFGADILPWRLVAALPVLSVAQPGRLVTYVYLLIAVLVALWLARPAWRTRPAAPSPYPPSSPLWRPTPLPRRWPHLLRWLLVVAAAATILPNFASPVWATQVPETPFLASGIYKQYLTPGEILWIVDAHHDRQLIWQADTHFYFRLAGGFFGGTPAGVRQGALQESLAEGNVIPTTTAAAIKSFLKAHRVGAVLVADEPWDIVLKMRAVTGVRWDHIGRVHLFRLGTQYSRPAKTRKPVLSHPARLAHSPRPAHRHRHR